MKNLTLRNFTSMASISLHLPTICKRHSLPKSRFVHPIPRAFVHPYSPSASDNSGDSRDKPASESESTPPARSPPPATSTPPPPTSTSTFASYFSDVKASLKQQQQEFPQHRPSHAFPQKPYSFSPPKPRSKDVSLDEIRKNLAGFRSRTAPPPPIRSAGSSVPPEHQKRDGIGGPGEASVGGKGGRLSFEAIAESLRQLKSIGSEKEGRVTAPPLTAFKSSLKLQPADQGSTTVIRGSTSFSRPNFGNEARHMDEARGDSESSSTELVKNYNYQELGEKLRNLRPKVEGENWFSLGELNERLGKLRSRELIQPQTKLHGLPFRDLMDSLSKLKFSEDQKARRSTIQRLDVLGQLRDSQSSIMSPPKDHLVEKYFHPDNMSASEKLKIELKKTRDEFKISESDCGSTQVQVAQLTMRINHFAGLLHRKDKHNRKGLRGMENRRKRLLIYLRRTNFDSYCYIIQRLGLKDLPPPVGKKPR